MEILTTIRDALVNKWTVGVSLVVVGVSTIVTPPMSDVLNRVWFAIPLVGFDVTILRFMGVLTLALGVAALTKQDPLGVKAEV
jgi:hypothetical protein